MVVTTSVRPSGGIPVLLENEVRLAHFEIADLAHLVERNLAKVEVAGSSPVIRLSLFSDVRMYIAFFALSSV